MDENHTIGVYAIFAIRCYASKIYCMLLHLLCYRFGKWCIWFAISIVVRFCCGFLWERKLIHFFISDFKRLPFDWKNAVGYSIAFVLQFIVLMCLYHFASVSTAFEIGGYFLIMVLINDIENDFNLINTKAKAKRNESSSSSSSSGIGITTQFHVAIQFHSIVKKLSINLVAS